jgi:hypothetical protein
MIHPDFPRLTPANHRTTSPKSTAYNCIAWAAGRDDGWWEPGVSWPFSIPSKEYSVAVLEGLFRFLGYHDCGLDATLEFGVEKVAIYGDTIEYSHAARQLADGKWTSKLGEVEDIEHDTPHDVAGGIYGEVVQIMKRQRST